MLGHSQLSIIPVSGDLRPCPGLLGHLNIGAHTPTDILINNQNQVSVFGLPVSDIDSELRAEQVAKGPLVTALHSSLHVLWFKAGRIC